MSNKIKNIIIFVLVAIFLLDLLNTIISPEVQLFKYPMGSDYGIGSIIGYDTFKIIEIAVVVYAIKRWFKLRERTSKV